MTRKGLSVLLLVVIVAFGLLVALVGCGMQFPVRRMACAVAERGVVPESPSPFPPVTDADWARGPEDAGVTFIAYLDLQCRHSAELEQVLTALRAAYPDDLRVVVRHFPLDALHDKARFAAQGVEAAGAQGQFWPMMELLFDEQSLWANMTPADFQPALVELAAQLGLDAKQFAADLESEQIVAFVKRAYDDAIALGLDGTPALAINGQYYEGPMDEWTLSTYIELLLLEERQFHECPPLQLRARKDYTATLHTSQGDIVIRLLPEQAPLAVNNFVFLTRQGWYNGVPFHRVIPEYVIQTGDPSGTGMGGPGYTFADEIVPGALFDRAGAVGMAGAAAPGAAAPGAGSQFFITYGAQPMLNGQHTLFGQVVAGMDVAARLTPRDPATDPTGMPEADRILSVEIIEK